MSAATFIRSETHFSLGDNVADAAAEVQSSRLTLYKDCVMTAARQAGRQS
jgi:hypothetical protein